MDKIISKSKYIAGLQCIKYLWYLENDPEAIPPFDEVTQFRFQQGQEVGNLAKSLFPEGIEIEHSIDINAELARARELTSLTATDISISDDKSIRNTNIRNPLFEPAFTYKNAFARADILEPSGNEAWNIIEVKSASSIKDINKDDISFQKYCYEGAGLKINKCYLMYLNKNFIKYGPIDPQKFFVMDDITAEAEILKENVEENINLMLEAISSKTCPEIKISKNCYNPYECPLKQVCWSYLPKNNVFELYRGKDIASYFYQKGIVEISQINETSKLNTIQLMQYKAAKEKCAYTDRESIKIFLSKLKYPLYFLDFETFATAIPLFDGLKPYQNIPFQFSCHIMKSPDAKPESLYFLAEDDKKDPRVHFLKNLKKALGYGDKYNNNNNNNNKYSSSASGSIFVYYESFEKNILKELIRIFPEHTWWVENAIDRMVDLYEPFGKFYYYSTEQKGSTSLKNVLPAITGISYDEMEIKNGEEAAIRYLNITFLKGEKEPEKAQVDKIKKDLLDYCGLDTKGMIYILKKLYEMVSCDIFY